MTRLCPHRTAAALPALDLPTRADARVGVRTYRSRLVEHAFDMRQVRQVCRRASCTEFMVLLAGYALALAATVRPVSA